MTTLIILLMIGVLAGVFSGFIGIGGGLIVVPCLVYFMGMGQHAAQGTSLAMMLPPIGIIAVYNYYKAGQVDFKIAAILCASFIIGSFFGSKIAIGLPADQIKKAFGIIIILLGLKMVFWK
ncbi:MAG: sulfite exporter TauE/SafE family protein [Chitinophagales bacterium]|nr:sulfite exporter TauE/SafE family protein [Chitinophagaceae bacterium]MBP9882618.1 sulfite exporter TauE/SafE family protein [Chitinophagales bacterium]